MNFRKNMGLIVGAGSGLVLIVVALLLLFKYSSAYAEVNQQLQQSLRRLDALHHRKPAYPSKENVDQAAKNLEILEGFHSSLVDDLRRGQVEPAVMEPAEFHQLLETTFSGADGLRKRAAQAGVTLPPKFAFGFDRYTQGALPQPQHIERLVVQLRSAARLVKLLYGAKISELTVVKRDTFDEETAAETEPEFIGSRGRVRPGGRPPRGQPEPAPAAAKPGLGLFAKESFTLAFTAREEAIWAALDAFATSDMLTVVTGLALDSSAVKQSLAAPRGPAGSRPGATPGMAGRVMITDAFPAQGEGEMPVSAASARAERDALPMSRDERLVAGSEKVKVVLSVDVYRFMGPEEEAEPTS